MKHKIHTWLRNPFLQHGVFWTISYYILLNVFSLASSLQRIDFIYTAIFLVSVIVPVLLNLYLLIPYFLKKGHYLYYLGGFLVVLFLFTWMNQLIFGQLIDLIFPGYFFISFYTYGDLLKFFLVFLVVTTLLQLSKEWFELNATRQKMLLLEKDKVDAELKALANQVNPHFLFNSLNVIYSLVISKRRESPEAILKLSDILRYVIYGSSGDQVSLEKEIQLIRNYIDLQRFRVGQESRITFDVEGGGSGLMLAPMLLLPLVENGFKHGIKGDVDETYLDIALKVNGNALNFSVKNNKGLAYHDGGQPDSGVGLANIRNRLQLLYPGAHEFIIKDSGDRFSVNLIIRNLMTGKQQ